MRTITTTGASGGLKCRKWLNFLSKDKLILVGRSKEKLENYMVESENIDLVELDDYR